MTDLLRGMLEDWRNTAVIVQLMMPREDRNAEARGVLIDFDDEVLILRPHNQSEQPNRIVYQQAVAAIWRGI